MRKRKSDHELAEEIANHIANTPSGGRGPAADDHVLLQHAANAGGGGLRQQYLQLAQREIAKLDPARHRATIQRLQSQVLALQGRGGDNRIAHVTPGEIVIPTRLQTPQFMAAFVQLARAHGIDPAQFQVGNARNRVNPQTGQIEFQDEYLPNPSQPDNGEIYRDTDGNIVEGIEVEAPRTKSFWEDPMGAAGSWVSEQIAKRENLAPPRRRVFSDGTRG